MSDWSAFHLYYHEDRDLLLRSAVQPLVDELLLEGQIERFFFIRYSLGGPHIRLRMEHASDAESSQVKLKHCVSDHMSRFFAEHPSQESMDPSTIEAQNKAILETDPNETDATVHADGSWISAPFRPETTRYGGAEYLPASFDFFMVSSRAALLHTEQTAGMPSSKKLIQCLAKLIHQAWGGAEDAEHFANLLRYAVEGWGAPMNRILQKADAVFESRPTAWVALVYRELQQAAEGGHGSIEEVSAAGLLSQGAKVYRGQIATLEPERRFHVTLSQMHMTAVRLGLVNAEEVYLSRLMTRCVEALQGEELWSKIESNLASTR